MKSKILYVLSLVFLCALLGYAQDFKTITLSEDGLGENKYRITVSADGKQVVLTSYGGYFIYDENGKFLFRAGVPQGSSSVKLFPTPINFDPLVKYVAIDSYAGGHVALCRADGSEIKTIVGKSGGTNERLFHADGTGWTNPTGGAIDFKNRFIFATESTQPTQDEISPVWSRIAMFDLDGQFIRSINFYNFYAQAGSEQRAESRRHWYQDVTVDPTRQRIYAIARNVADNTKELLSFSYDGTELGRVKTNFGDYVGIAYLPVQDCIAVGSGWSLVLHDPNTLAVRANIAMPSEANQRYSGISGLAADELGNLYATVRDPAINYIRWNADDTVDVFGPLFLRVAVQLPTRLFVGGQTYRIPIGVTGRPEVADHDNWHIYVREANGKNLRWTKLPTSYDPERWEVIFTVPENLRGGYTMAVKFGEGPISIAEFNKDTAQLFQTVFVPSTATKALSISATTARTAFVKGENINLELLRRETVDQNSALAPINVECQLIYNGKVVENINIAMTKHAALVIPAAITARLATGEYEVKPISPGFESYAFPMSIVSSYADSSMQRIFYHEFGQTVLNGGGSILPDTAERLAGIREIVATVSRLGFNRETDRTWPGQNGNNRYLANAFNNGMDYDGMAYGEWLYYNSDMAQQDFYMDMATKYNVAYDAQVLPHCATSRISDTRINELLGPLARSAEWASRYPSFYGFNYNDEMFSGGTGDWKGYDSAWTLDDAKWLKDLIDNKFDGDGPKANIMATKRMYTAFNSVVSSINPKLGMTTTPMWQFPAVEGSYIPAFFDGVMTETYSHFLGEGYTVPFLPAHSAEMMKRPGLPLMALAENGYGTTGADLYQKTTFQLLTRGPQGIGVSHTEAFQDPLGANSFTTMNKIAKELGPIFATAKRDDAGFVLYSYTQDVKQTRRASGTPHWEAVYGTFSAGLMAGVPLGIIYEEDVVNGVLIENNKPKVPMLFLSGIAIDLPQNVRQQIERYKQIGGKIYVDSESKGYPGATLIDMNLSFDMHLGYASDTAMQLFADELEPRAKKMREAAFANVPYKILSSNLWNVSTSFVGGSARYIIFAYESTRFPWESGVAWGTGAMYAKQKNTWFPTANSALIPTPTRDSIVYDLLAQKEATLQASEVTGMSKLDIDLTVLPGRIYAVLPSAIGAPKIAVNQQGAVANLAVAIQTSNNTAMAALVPLRVRVFDGEQISEEIFRTSTEQGRFAFTFNVPANGNFKVEVTELITGKSATAALNAVPFTAQTPVMTARGNVDIERQEQIYTMIKQAAEKNMPIKIVTGSNVNPDGAAINKLMQSFTAKRITVQNNATVPATAEPGLYISLGLSTNDNTYGLLTREAWNKNLLGNPRTPRYPGEGRGYVSACFAPRSYNENVIVVMGGDAAGLTLAINALTDTISKYGTAIQTQALGLERLAPAKNINGTTDAGTVSNTYIDEVGIVLNGIQLSSNNKDMIISASGFNKNLITVTDNGNSATIVNSMRVGQSPDTKALFISADGTKVGAVARTIDNRLGQGFYLAENKKDGRIDAFSNYGDMPRHYYGSAATSDGQTIVVGGTYGALCYKNVNGTWTESWCFDYQKEFDKLEWPISDTAERIPQFHAYIPEGKDYAILCFGEMTEQGWVTGENIAGIKIYSLKLSDGSINWEYNVPIPTNLLFPTLYTSPKSTKMVLKVQVGTWGKQTYSFFSIDPETGKELGRWDAANPMGIALSDANGNIAVTYENRLLEVKSADNKIIYNFIWQYAMPLSVAFAPDGNSLYVTDDRGIVTLLDKNGDVVWSKDMGTISTVAANSNGLYAAGWDGKLRAYAADGKERWVINLTDTMSLYSTGNPGEYLKDAKLPEGNIHKAKREANTTTTVPEGENLLLKPGVTFRIGGTSGWMSGGRVEIKAEELKDGDTESISQAWIHVNELFWNGQAGRQVWAEASFDTPTRVNSITAYEDKKHPDSFTNEALIQIWSDDTAKWETVIYGRFMNSSINTFPVNLDNVTKIRYAPWGRSYYNNVYVTEIEIR